MAQRVKEPVLPQLWHRLQLWHRSNPWPENFDMPWVWPKINKLKKKKKGVQCWFPQFREEIFLWSVDNTRAPGLGGGYMDVYFIIFIMLYLYFVHLSTHAIYFTIIFSSPKGRIEYLKVQKKPFNFFT